jgi:hypothetical protein
VVDELHHTLRDPIEAAELTWGRFELRFDPPVPVVTRRQTHKRALLGRANAVVVVDYQNETMTSLRLVRGPWRRS